MNKNNIQIIYSQQVIEFTTVVAECCRFLENLTEITKSVFIEKILKLFSLLYLKTLILELPENQNDISIERFVSQEDYALLKENIVQILGADDSYLDTFQSDMQYSDMPIAATISENVADIYQEIRDYAQNYQLENEQIMNDALLVCYENFGEHWGQKLLNAIRALHTLKFDIRN